MRHNENRKDIFLIEAGIISVKDIRQLTVEPSAYVIEPPTD